MKRYMKDHFDFFGIQAKERRALQRNAAQKFRVLDRKTKDKVILELWQVTERECQYAAVDWLCGEVAQHPKGYHTFVETLVCQKSWWDTVDPLAAWAFGAYLLKYPEEAVSVTQSWMASGNLWLQRCALLYQLKYREKTDSYQLYGFIRQLTGTKEFFLQKAMGWALREYAKTDPEEVRQFVASQTLPALTKREASKHL